MRLPLTLLPVWQVIILVLVLAPCALAFPFSLWAFSAKWLSVQMPQISERNVGHAVLLAVGPSASLSSLSAIWGSEHLYLVFYDMSRTTGCWGEGGSWRLLYVETELVNHLGRFLQLHVLKDQTGLEGTDRSVNQSALINMIINMIVVVI